MVTTLKETKVEEKHVETDPHVNRREAMGGRKAGYEHTDMACTNVCNI